MFNPQQIKNILKENNISALKKFGQNFLISESVLNKIVKTANIKTRDTILEIGPGLGALTFELAKRASKVIAVEKDRKMAEVLQKNLAKNNILNVEVTNEDALENQKSKIKNQKYKSKFKISRDPTSSQILSPSPWEVGSLLAKPYKIVANLPYNIATAVIMQFLQSENPPQKMVVMTQKEVAQRITAKVPHMNKLAIFSQLYSEPKIIEIVPPSAFWPKPKVDSAILQLAPLSPETRFLGSPKIGFLQPKQNRVLTAFTSIVSAGFSHPRKTLLNNFIKLDTKEKIIEWFKENNISPIQRPETLTVNDWLKLTNTFKPC